MRFAYIRGKDRRLNSKHLYPRRCPDGVSHGHPIRRQRERRDLCNSDVVVGRPGGLVVAPRRRSGEPEERLDKCPRKKRGGALAIERRTRQWDV